MGNRGIRTSGKKQSPARSGLLPEIIQEVAVVGKGFRFE
jgi:hypothetical protein